MQKVLLAGAQGLVGGFLRREALGAGAEVVGLVRRQPVEPAMNEARWRAVTVDFGALEKVREDMAGATVALCALGTTIRRAGSPEAFRAVDFDAVLAFARAAQAAGVERFGVVSSLGADAGARVFYNRVKGEMEAAVGELGFRHVVVARPSLLRGARREFRLGERIGLALAWGLKPVLIGRWRRYRAIQAETVARALWRTVQGETGAAVRVLESEELARLGG